MIPLSLLGLVLPLALDTFAVSAAAGLTGLDRRHRLRLSLLFAAFEGGTPAVGLLLAGPLGAAIGGAADYLAIAVLVGFGLFTLLRDEDGEGDKATGLATAHGAALLLLGLSVSLDELAVGFTLGLLRLPVLPCLVAIGVQAFVVSQLGFRLGGVVSERFREAAERLAGVVLLLLAGVLILQRATA